jgi:hypothetical protein
MVAKLYKVRQQGKINSAGNLRISKNLTFYSSVDVDKRSFLMNVGEGLAVRKFD